MAKKRANGEGNIRKRKDGRWEGRYTAGHDPITGKRITKNVLGKTQAEVREKLRRTMEETRGLDVARAGEYTIGQWLEVWFSDYAALKVRPSSHQTYRGYLDHHIKPYIGGIPLTKLSSLDLQRLYKRLLSDLDLCYNVETDSVLMYVAIHRFHTFQNNNEIGDNDSYE